jgi:hypothetical protein
MGHPSRSALNQMGGLDVILATVDATHSHLPARRTHTSIHRNLPLVSFPR